MSKPTIAILVSLFFLFPLGVRAQQKLDILLTNHSDVSDTNLTDGFTSPQTLRSIIQNLNIGTYNGFTPNIIVTPMNSTIEITSPLPDIRKRMILLGRGLVIRPSKGSTALQGLAFGGNRSEIHNTAFEKFPINGLVWRCDSGFITNVICRNNKSANLQLDGADGNIIGDVPSGTIPINSYFFGGDYGITMYRSHGNTLLYCSSGIDTFYIAAPNKVDGISLDECHNNILRRCIVAGNTGNGISIDGFNDTTPKIFQSSGNRIENNCIGMTAFGDTVGNGGIGIFVDNSTDDVITDNFVAANKGTGIFAQAVIPGGSNSTTSRVRIEHNFVGTSKSSKIPYPNGRGIYIRGMEQIVRNNVISGNIGIGLAVSGANNIIQGNIIGLDSTQQVAVPNGIGISIDMRPNLGRMVIGDTLGSSWSNIIAGNRGNGVVISGGGPVGQGTKNVVVARNMIGANKDTVTFPNGGSGISVAYNVSDITVRNNLLPANGKDGIHLERNVVYFLDTTKPPIYQRPSGITIYGNCIGCGKRYDSTLWHGGSGIYTLNVEKVYIDSNIIFNTRSHGISINNDSTRNISIIRNWIGSDTAPFYKEIQGDGIHISGAQDVRIGDILKPTEGNTLGFCKGYAVGVQDGAQRVSIVGNWMGDNTLGGIALDDLNNYFKSGAYNDNFDADSGSNMLQNTIDQTVGETTNNSIHIAGSFKGMPNTSYTVDAYLAKQLPLAFANRTRGRTYLGWFNITTDANGKVNIDTTWDDAKVQQFGSIPFVTMTVTGISGTSEFSHIGPPPTGIDVVLTIDTSKTMIDQDGVVTLVADITNLGTDDATTVSIRDTTSDFNLSSVSISKGVALIVDSTFTAAIPSLAYGEHVEFTAIGKVRSNAPHWRRPIALPSENDLDLSNNFDTILLQKIGSSVLQPQLPEIRIQMIDGLVKLLGLPEGMYIINVHTLLGQLQNQKQCSEQDMIFPVRRGCNVVNILRDGVSFYRTIIWRQ